jgi:galactose-1-phosphate uridylyltransferase
MDVNEDWVTKKDLAAAVEPLASKEDLAQLRAEVKQDMAQLRTEFKQDLAEAIQQVEERIVNRLTEAIRDSQTEVLRAFYNWARPIEVRLNRTDEIATRLSWIEERIAALERGKFPTSH